MGNHTGKNSNGPTASPLDFFHTPPTTPLEADLTAMALSSAASSNKAQTPSPPSSTTPSTTSPIADYTQKLSATSEWAVISVDSVTSTETNVSDAAARYGKAVVSLGSPASQPSFTTPSEQTWQERDSGLEPQAAAERAGEEVTLALLGLMEDYRASLGLSPNIDVTSGPVDLLRHLMAERDELAEEVDTLKETLRTERLEWHQFQCDLQVAVSVADRLRAESEEALGLLQESHRVVEERLSQALNRQQVTEKELESLRAEHSDICCRLTEFTLQQQEQQQQQIELDTLENTSRVKGREACDTQPEGQGEEIQDVFRETEESESKNVEKEKETRETQNTGHGPENEIGSGLMHITGKRVAEGYICSLASLGKKKEEGRGQRDPRKIVMLSERSWSLSRLPLPTDTSSQSGTLIDTSTTLPLCKKEEPTKGRKMDRILQRQDSWSSFYTVKQDEDQSTESIKPQDGFSALLRRHGGSRRNSLLRWCQSRTQGYKNIEITNFSSSWEDGLAFCAVYHTYLPTYIPYGSLNPADKKENLALAFKTGENVGISAILTVEEMLKADGPDWQKVLAYVESIFRHFEM